MEEFVISVPWFDGGGQTERDWSGQGRNQVNYFFLSIEWLIILKEVLINWGILIFFVYEFLGINPPPFFDRTYETISSWIFLTPFTEASISECQMWTKLWNKIFYFGIEFCIEIVRQASEMLYYYLSCFHFTYYLCLFIGS